MEVEVLPHLSQMLNAIIKRNSEMDWLFTAIYAISNPSSRKELWEYLAGVVGDLKLTWTVAGDWNEVRGSSEMQCTS